MSTIRNFVIAMLILFSFSLGCSHNSAKDNPGVDASPRVDRENELEENQEMEPPEPLGPDGQELI